MRASLKVRSLVLLCWPTMSKADVGGMAIVVEPSHQYFVTLCFCVTNGSRGGGMTWKCVLFIESLNDLSRKGP